MKKVIFLLIIISVTIIFSSCTSLNVEKDIRDKFAPDVPEITTRSYQNDINTFELKSLGDEITIDNTLYNVTYTINSVKTFNCFKDSGIDEKDLCVDLDESNSSNPFVLINLTVKVNKNNEQNKELNIGEFTLMNKDVLSDPWKLCFPGIAYFDHYKKEPANEYYHYTLNEGEEATFQLGWILKDPIPTTKDLVLHVGASISLKNYVDLSTQPKSES